MRFACLGATCKQNCCGPFHGTRAVVAVLSIEDLGRPIAEARQEDADISIFAQIRLTPADVARLRSAGYDDVMVYRGAPERPDYYLRLRDDGSCSALSDTGTCTIHPHRPTLCRAFPFYLDLFAGLCMVEACPGIGGEEVPLSKVAGEIDAALEMYGFWLGDIRQRLRGQ